VSTSHVIADIVVCLYLHNALITFYQRGVIQDTKVDRDVLTKLIEVHLEMYMGGRGGRYQSQSQTQVDPHTPTRPTSISQATPDAGVVLAAQSPVNGLPSENKNHALATEKKGGNEDSDMDLTLGNLTLDSDHLDMPISEVLFDSSSSPEVNIE
jgi:hypothetical protein